MADESDYFRGYARDVGVSPLVNGANNVQDALAAIVSAPVGTLVQSASTAFIAADASTTITFDGSRVNLGCIVASPPAWMDGASNIIEAGMYQAFIALVAGVAPTTPGLYLSAGFVEGSALVPVDGLAVSNVGLVGDVFNLEAVDLPYGISLKLIPPTDVTGTATAAVTIVQLATVTT